MSLAVELVPPFRRLPPVIGAVADKRPVAFAALFTLIACGFAITTAHLPELPRWAAAVFLALGLALGGRAAGALFAAAAACFVWALVADWYVMANHGFIITYFALFFAFVRTGRGDFWVQGEFVARSLLMLLMGVALLQKLSSPYYLSGNQFADMLLGGESYLSILTLLDARVTEVVAGAISAEQALGLDYAQQAAGGFAALPEPGLVLLVAIYGMTWVSIGLQGALEAALIFRQRFGIWLHRLIFCFTLAVFTLRPENIFLSLNLLMGYALTDERSRAMRLPYAAAILFLVVTAVIGVRPGLLR